MCLKVENLAIQPLALPLRVVKENSMGAERKQWPGSAQNTWKWVQMLLWSYALDLLFSNTIPSLV